MSEIHVHEPRCSDALDRGCPDRKNCARWMFRVRNNGMTTPWEKFAERRGPTGCEFILKITKESRP